MPVTQRHAVHDGKKGLSACINYCKDIEKTNGGKLISGVNCSSTFAFEEFIMIHEKYNPAITIDDTERICYHAWQSFDYRDNVSEQEVHKMGVELCKELYPEFQCLVCTHTDKGHLHNHIIINSRNLNGRKLEDRLGNVIEGLYGLRDASDKIALEHGCSVIKDAPKIGRYKAKNYTYSSATSWKSIISSKIEDLKVECSSFDELLEKLSFEGYVIKQGKHIAILPVGKERAVRLKTLGKNYTEESLKLFFYEKRRSTSHYHFEDRLVCKNESEIIMNCVDAAENAKLAIIQSEKGLRANENYPKYFNTRYQELKRYHELVKNIEFLNQENIYSYENLIDNVNALRTDIEMLEYNYKKDKTKNNTFQARVEIAEVYIQKYNSYLIYKEDFDMFGKAEQSDDVKMFLNAKAEMNNADISEVREFLANASKQKSQLNKSYAKLSFLKHRLSELDKLREKSLDVNPQYIKSISFGKDMVDDNNCNKSEYCIRIPYTKQYLYIPKDNVIWQNYAKRGTIYLIDDKPYNLYDDNKNIINTIEGDQLEKLMNDNREIVIEKSKQHVSN